ncbi:hypothetical protein C8Q80DRAFT_1116617 [Daedaleopsis nitida]|nr:hypothetical protein C8Q80DRAFT_1116617 [Daedaleopsis nitida]
MFSTCTDSLALPLTSSCSSLLTDSLLQGAPQLHTRGLLTGAKPGCLQVEQSEAQDPISVFHTNDFGCLPLQLPGVALEMPPAQPGQAVPPLRPASYEWLRNPAYIDGALAEPQLYYSQEELHESHKAALAAAGLLSLQNNQAPLANHAGHGPGEPAADLPRAATPDAPQLSPPIEIPDSPTSNDGPPPNPLPDSDVDAGVGADHATTAASAQPPADVYLIQVMMTYVEATRSAPGRGSKVVPKPKSVTKIVSAPLAGLTRADFVRVLLDAHGLAEQYGPGPLSGPVFKLYWTGVTYVCDYTKTNAVTIENDKDFGVAHAAILGKRSCNRVCVEFNVDDLNDFHLGNKRPFLPDGTLDAVEELTSGTQACHVTVPRVDAFPDQTQLHGALIMELKKLHPCRDHLSESNEPGSCYKPTGRGTDAHVRLNNRRLKQWAAAVASGDASKWHPPNTEDFGQSDNGNKPRGRSGPHPVHPSPVLPPPADATSLMMSMAPLIAMMTAGHHFASTMAGHSSPVAYSASHAPCTPTHTRTFPPTLMSPLPARGEELHQFLLALHAQKDIDLLACETSLAQQDFTPDIMPSLTLLQLKAVTGAVDGTLVKMQIFAGNWNKRQEEKRKHIL